MQWNSLGAVAQIVGGGLKSAHKRRVGKNRHKTRRRLNGGNKGWVVGPCQCLQPPQAVAEGQHLQEPTAHAQSAPEVDDQVHEINPFQAPTIERNELRAVYARILAATNSSDCRWLRIRKRAAE